MTTTDTNALYTQRLGRYVAAMRNEQADCVPIRPFVAEFTATYAGYTCQQVTHDYNLAFEAACKTAAGFDWDAVVPNMVWVWTGLTRALDLTYYAVPGIDLPPHVGFQYKEPPEEDAFMRAEEYDALIDDPTAFLLETWLPRVSASVAAPGESVTRRHSLALIKGGMAMMQYFAAYGPHIARLRDECGVAGAIAGILKAPFDIIADKLRGYIGLTMDMHTQPDKVLRACEALMPHLFRIALDSSDPAGLAPIGFWMHRGCSPLVRPDQFDSHYWPTLKPIIEELWANGRQTLFYAEGDWNRHLDSFAELPDASIVYHADRGDIFEIHQKLGRKFCISGGVPNDVLAFGTPDQVRARCAQILERIAPDGGYIMDASAIIQNDAAVENIRAMTDYTREHGVYDRGRTVTDLAEITSPAQSRPKHKPTHRSLATTGDPRPGVCIPWAEEERRTPRILGDPDIVRRVWESTDALAHTFAWHCLLSF